MFEMEWLLTAPFNQTLKESEGDQEEAKKGETLTGDVRWLSISASLISSTLSRNEYRTSPSVISLSWYGHLVLNRIHSHNFIL